MATFTTRKHRRGESWDVMISWRSGSSAVVPGFATDADAAAWIRDKSADWLRSRQTGSHDITG